MNFQYKCSYATRPGILHAKENLPCQDKIAVLRQNSICAAALADGAGSQPRSDKGAELVSQEAVRLLTEQFGQLWGLNDEERTNALLTALLLPLQKEAPPVKELASTLLFIAGHHDGRFLTGHIGDGAIVWVDDEGTFLYSSPENGTFANETFFLTGEDAAQHFRVKTGVLRQSGAVLLMSDGMAESLIRRSDQTPAPACAAMAKWLQDEEEDRISQAYARNLEQVFSHHSQDDLGIATVAWNKICE